MMFILFGGGDYYPNGGAQDLLSVHDTLDEAIAALPQPEEVDQAWDCQWAHVWSAETQMIVKRWAGRVTHDPAGPRPEIVEHEWVELADGQDRYDV